MLNFLQIATALVEKGFSVIPIEPNGKRQGFIEAFLEMESDRG